MKHRKPRVERREEQEEWRGEERRGEERRGEERRGEERRGEERRGGGRRGEERRGEERRGEERRGEERRGEERRGEEEVVDEGMREKEKMEGGKEIKEWRERVTEKGRECSSFRTFLRGTSLHHFLLKEFSVEQCIMCSMLRMGLKVRVRTPTLFWGNMYA